MNSSGQSSSKFRRLWEVLTTTLTGSIPDLFGGARVRSLVYSTILKKLGASTYIQSGVELLGGWAITLESSVSLFNGVRIDARGPDNEVYIGSDTSLQRGVEIRALKRSRVHLGQRVFIGSCTYLAGPGNIEIGDNCSIAAHCGIFANQHKFDDPTLGPNDQGLTWQGIVIEKNCWIGHGVSILDGVTIGEGSVIGAGAVVTQTIPSYSIAVGVPAKVIKRRDVTHEPVDN